MTFSILAALLGMATIGWYGMADMGAYDMEQEKKRLAACQAEDDAAEATAAAAAADAART